MNANTQRSKKGDYKSSELENFWKPRREYSTVESTEVMTTIVNYEGSVYELCIDLVFTLQRGRLIQFHHSEIIIFFLSFLCACVKNDIFLILFFCRQGF